MNAVRGPRPSTLLLEAERYLAAHGVESPRAEAEALLVHLLRTDRAGLYAAPGVLDEATLWTIRCAVRQRAEGVPLQHLTGEQSFCGLHLRVRPGVFVPRLETEVLVEHAVECLTRTAEPTVVDVGAGTGAVALALKTRRPDARVLATDISEEAVDLCLENAERLGLPIEVIAGDLLDPLPGELRGRVDLVVSNPPYVTEEEYPGLPPEVRADPVAALVGGTEVHARLARTAPGWLRPGGWLVMEIGEAQGVEVGSILAGAYERVEVAPDLAGRDRIVRGLLPAG